MPHKPNVLLVTTDHWPASLHGEAGHDVIQTPTLDTLCRAGTRFTNAYTECPVCIPARRTLMTGTTPCTHGDRIFKDTLEMPSFPTLAQCFRDAGYQAHAAGKLHVYPQRDRIGFDDVILDEEGRLQYGAIDDYEMFLAEQGYAGKQFSHGMSNNQYSNRPWHLPEHCHPTNWVTEQMVKTIKRRDPRKPGFWYLFYRHPHPPLTPLQAYLDMYDPSEIDMPYHGTWVDGRSSYCVDAHRSNPSVTTEKQIRSARRGFYALCTHIDHQLRVVIGTLREEGLLDNTIICITADHGDMLGNHGMWAKRVFYENSANIPMILVGTKDDDRVVSGATDERVVGLQDVMPTLLSLAGIPAPDTVDGVSMLSKEPRGHLYGECNEDATATRMVRKDAYKLIYYPVGHHIQLFDIDRDPHELTDLSESSDHRNVLAELVKLLAAELNGTDTEWLDKDRKLVGLPAKQWNPGPNKGLSGQRGGHFPQPPITNLEQGVMP